MEKEISINDVFPKSISGLTLSSLAYFLSNAREKQILVILPDEELAETLTVDVNTFFKTMSKSNQPNKAILFPALDKIGDLPVPEEILGERLSVLINLSKQEDIIVITSVKAMEGTDYKIDGLRNKLVVLNKGDTINITEFTDRIVKSGYKREYLVEKKGEWSMRGGIIDIYPFESENPVRLELDGNNVFSIRSFDCFDQRTKEILSSFEIFLESTTQNERNQPNNNLLDYFENKMIVVHNQCYEIPDIQNKKVVYTSALDTGIDTSINEIKKYNVKSISPFMGNIDLLKKEIDGLMVDNYRLTFFSLNEGEKLRLIEIFNENGFFKYGLDNSKISFEIGLLSSGFIWKDIDMAVFTDAEIFGRYATRSKTRKYRIRKSRNKGLRISDLVDMQPGDYVVHNDYGIGRFLGICNIEVDGSLRDFMTIEYQSHTEGGAGDKLHVPLNKINVISKYISDKEPVLDKLYSSRWMRTKEHVREKTKQIAKELIELSAARETLPGFAFSRDTHWQNEFDSEFIYDETEDQLKAIEEVKQDMEDNKPMDRLVCGDVGYGKTEVAMRAAFKAMMDKKQVAVLAPTTILVEQHYNTFRERMADYPINISMLSRFRTQMEQKKVLQDMSKGLVDIVIGTHRLLQKDIKFYDLGLIIVDEEQRFGVRAKETLKQLKKTVDVLTLTATPIPRTLHIALSGIKKISTINTPPEGRMPIETYCFAYNEKAIKDAIEREIKRGGQIFYLYNRIETIEKIKQKIKSLVGNARIAVAHGRMESFHLEQIIKKFINKDYDILLSTTIIENGLDMPNVNTIIIENAHRFGLAELYQLRGRVGRGTKKAYAYITYPEYSSLSLSAIERLKAIEECSELGAGLKVALKDLEIRGAGNILGPQQHGYIAKIGFDLYTQLLSEAVMDEMGQKEVVKEEEPEILLKVDAYIPDTYVSNDIQKINTYRKISVVKDKNELNELKDEVIDVYGKMPNPMMNLFALVKIKLLAKKLNVKSIKETDKNILIEYYNGKKINIKKDQISNNIEKLCSLLYDEKYEQR